MLSRSSVDVPAPVRSAPRRPVCRIRERAWRQMVVELDRVAPREGVMVPLVALTMRDPESSPCAPVRLDDIEQVLLPVLLPVPPHRQVNQPWRVHVLPDTDPDLNRCIRRAIHRFPRLRPCAFLHSHPFARGSTAPSGGPGGDVEGHMRPQLDRNLAGGLEASFSFIACRGPRGTGWRLQGFALVPRGAVLDLGFAEVVADDDPGFRRALVEGLAWRPGGRTVLGRWRRELERRSPGYRIDELFGGWTRTVVELGGGMLLVVLLPVDFPAGRPRFHVVDRSRGTSWGIEPPEAVASSPEGWGRIVTAGVDRRLDPWIASPERRR